MVGRRADDEEVVAEGRQAEADAFQAGPRPSAQHRGVAVVGQRDDLSEREHESDVGDAAELAAQAVDAPLSLGARGRRVGGLTLNTSRMNASRSSGRARASPLRRRRGGRANPAHMDAATTRPRSIGSSSD